MVESCAGRALLSPNWSLVTKQVQLARPPLREALLEIRLAEMLPVSFAEELKSRDIANLKYVGPVKQGQFALQYGPTGAAQASVTQDELLGARFDSVERTRVVLLRRNGITCSIVGAYKNWAELRNWAQDIWRQFCGWTGDVVVHQLALRYINVVEVPVGQDFDHYLTSGPRVPRELPQFMAQFFERVVIPFSDIESQAIVTQATEPMSEGHVPVVLDIDVQSRCQLAANDEAMWSRFNKIREVKNLIFFSYITEKALEPYR